MMWVQRLQKHLIIDDQGYLFQRQPAELLEHITLTVCQFGSLIAEPIDRARAIELSHGEVKAPYGCETSEHRLINAVRPSGYVVRMADTDVEVKVSDSESLFIEVAGSCEALKDVAAMDSERVVRVGDCLGLEVYLAARAEDRQAKLARCRWRVVTVLMSLVNCSDVPSCSLRVCGVEVLLDLLFGGRLSTEGVG